MAQRPVADVHRPPPRLPHGQGGHHPHIQRVKLVRRLAHSSAAQAHRGVGVEGGHRAAGLLRDGREEGGLVRGQARGAGDHGHLGHPVNYDGLADQAAPWLGRLGDTV